MSQSTSYPITPLPEYLDTFYSIDSIAFLVTYLISHTSDDDVTANLLPIDPNAASSFSIAHVFTYQMGYH